MKQVKIKHGIIAVLMCCFPLSHLNAQEAQEEKAQQPDTLVVSLPDALDIALSESPTIKVADTEVQRVRYAKKETIGSLLPEISLSGAYQRALKKQRMVFDIPGMESKSEGIEIGQDNTFTGGISASLPIIAPSLWSTVNLSELELELSLESARSSKIALVNEVSKAYYGILMAQDSYNVIKRSYENSEENARIIKNKYEQGTVSEFEWIRADVQARTALTNVVSAESAVNLALLQLKMLMGVDMNVGLKVIGSLSDYEETMFETVMNIDTTTLKNNSDLMQFDIQTKQLEQSLKINKFSAIPTLAASINYQYMSMVNDEQTFTENHFWFPTSTLGVSLNIPLFQGGKTHNKNRQIKMQIEGMEYQRENLERSLELQVSSYMENIKKTLKKVDSDREAMKQAEKAMVISQKMYDVGMATFIDVSNAELTYIQSGLTYNQSIYDYLSNKADLEKILGDYFN